jgi:hypothetical protein
MRCDPAELESVAKRFRREMWRSAPTDAVIESGVQVREFGPVQATAFEDLPAEQSLNAIDGAAEPGAVEGGYLAEAVEWMRYREVDYRIKVAASRPGAEAAEAWLRTEGFEPGAEWAKYVREASPPHLPLLPEVEVIELGPGCGDGISDLASEGLGLPFLAGTLFYDLPTREGWHCYVALLDDEPVACGSMMVHEGVAELGLDATVESARGNGCHQALLTRRLLDAAVAGCHTVFAEVGESGGAKPAHRNLLCAGFQLAYVSRAWSRPRGLMHI